MDQHIYAAIDLKSFYASVECAYIGKDPLKTNLVVADKSRTDKTICLAVSPSLKEMGIPGRPRLFEVVERMRAINDMRRRQIRGERFLGKSCDKDKLESDPRLKADYIVAMPHMARYIDVSTKIYNIYLRYISPDDIIIYSIDEVFMDITQYIRLYGFKAEELVRKLIKEVFDETKITATAGIGTNLYLAKIAMDIVAKHMKPDEYGVRLASLDEGSYRRKLWTHRPLTDFWRVGKGYAKKLEANGLRTMGDIARCSLGKCGEFYSEELLYRLFGKNAELLIDHAWGWEPCTMHDIKSYKPRGKSLGAGQVLQEPYGYSKARLVVREMADELVLGLVSRQMETNQVVLTIGYDRQSIANPEAKKQYHGKLHVDHYGREVPQHAHGSNKLDHYTNSGRVIGDALIEIFDRVVQPELLVRRITVSASNIICEADAKRMRQEQPEQLNLFDVSNESAAKREREEKERALLRTVIELKQRFGKNSIVKGMDLQEGATGMTRNRQIGGHRA